MRLCWPHLSPLRVDGERRHDDVRPLPHQLPYEPCPLLADNSHYMIMSDVHSDPLYLLPRVIVPFEVAIVAVEADVEAVGEVAGLTQLLQEVHAVSSAAEASSSH